MSVLVGTLGAQMWHRSPSQIVSYDAVTPIFRGTYPLNTDIDLTLVNLQTRATDAGLTLPASFTSNWDQPIDSRTKGYSYEAFNDAKQFADDLRAAEKAPLFIWSVIPAEQIQEPEIGSRIYRNQLFAALERWRIDTNITFGNRLQKVGSSIEIGPGAWVEACESCEDATVTAVGDTRFEPQLQGLNAPGTPNRRYAAILRRAFIRFNVSATNLPFAPGGFSMRINRSDFAPLNGFGRPFPFFDVKLWKATGGGWDDRTIVEDTLTWDYMSGLVDPERIWASISLAGITVGTNYFHMQQSYDNTTIDGSGNMLPYPPPPPNPPPDTVLVNDYMYTASYLDDDKWGLFAYVNNWPDAEGPP